MQQTEAQRIAQRKYYEKNKLRINELHRDYYYNNKESLLRTKKITISHEPKTLYFS